MNAVEINGITWLGRDIMHGYGGRIEVMDHDECDALDDRERDGIRRAVCGMEIEDDDLTAEQADEGYIGADIVIQMDTTDSGWEIQVDWDESRRRREMRCAAQD